MLIDEVVITIKAGNGGDGSGSFRREKYVPKGGPDGGDGGHGGNVYFIANPSTHGLANFKGKKRFLAEDGGKGMQNLSHGKNGEDLYISVPPGTRLTQIFQDGTEQLLADLTEKDQTVLAAKSGKGGWGNWRFRSATNQAPTEFNPGTAGEMKSIRLELQLIADVGLVGLPNAGKSTLLSVASNARPKIADYPFTTLEPNLGMVVFGEYEFVMADIPGLIEGAASGKGLGHDFLKHVLRTNVLVHLVAATEEDPEGVYQTVMKEIDAFDPSLVKKPVITVMSKIDLFPEFAEYHKEFIEKHNAICISAATHQNVKELLYAITKQLDLVDPA